MELYSPRYRPATPSLTLTRNRATTRFRGVHPTPHLDVALDNIGPLQPLVLGDTDLLPDVLQVVQRFIQARHHLCRQHLTTEKPEVNFRKVAQGAGERSFLYANAS